MTQNKQIASEQMNYGFLLLVHLICADKQIHSEEVRYLNELSDRSKLSFTAKLFKHEQKSALSRAVIDMASKVAPEVIGTKVERLERQILLSGHEYDEAIENCSLIAKEDYQYAEVAFKKTESTLKTLILSLEEVI